jgi:hypothetical protein
MWLGRVPPSWMVRNYGAVAGACQSRLPIDIPTGPHGLGSAVTPADTCARSALSRVGSSTVDDIEGMSLRTIYSIEGSNDLRRLPSPC